MLRTLITLIILILLWYWLWGYFSDSASTSTDEPTQVGVDYDTYLLEALERNTQMTQKYDVIIEASDFYSGWINAWSSSLDRNILWEWNNTSHNSMSNNNKSSVDMMASTRNTPINNSWKDSNSSSSWNFGTPPIPGGWVYFDEDCHGLIFNPCLIIGSPIPASGGMDFGEWRWKL